MLPCEPQLRPHTFPGAVSCENQENRWYRWGQPHGCPQVVGLSVGVSRQGKAVPLRPAALRGLSYCWE